MTTILHLPDGKGGAFSGRAPKRAPAAPSTGLAPLRLPLLCKLVGASAGLSLTVVMVSQGGLRLSLAQGLCIAALLIVHAALMLIALRPIRDLESVARQVWQGDFAARVRASVVADHEVLRVGVMFNTLLDNLEAERTRMRALARDVVAAGDQERARVATELHDFTAQHLAALLFELSALTRDESDPALAARLNGARDTVQDILEDVRTLSQTVHSSVLRDLGLPAALQRLARELKKGTDVEISVEEDVRGARFPEVVESALYRVAYEAVSNAVRHASPRHIVIRLHRHDAMVRVEVRDDGAGFAAGEAIGDDAFRGLAAMRERMTLVEGTLTVDSVVGSGTTVTASAPADY